MDITVEQVQELYQRGYITICKDGKVVIIQKESIF